MTGQKRFFNLWRKAQSTENTVFKTIGKIIATPFHPPPHKCILRARGVYVCVGVCVCMCGCVYRSAEPTCGKHRASQWEFLDPGSLYEQNQPEHCQTLSLALTLILQLPYIPWRPTITSRLKVFVYALAYRFDNIDSLFKRRSYVDRHWILHVVLNILSALVVRQLFDCWAKGLTPTRLWNIFRCRKRQILNTIPLLCKGFGGTLQHIYIYIYINVPIHTHTLRGRFKPFGNTLGPSPSAVPAPISIEYQSGRESRERERERERERSLNDLHPKQQPPSLNVPPRGAICEPAPLSPWSSSLTVWCSFFSLSFLSPSLFQFWRFQYFPSGKLLLFFAKPSLPPSTQQSYAKPGHNIHRVYSNVEPSFTFLSRISIVDQSISLQLNRKITSFYSIDKKLEI